MHLLKKISKKTYAILFCIVSIVTISGCNNSKYTAEYDSSIASTSTTNLTFDNNEGQYYMPNGSAAAEDGYYYITENIYHNGNSQSTHSYFIDYYDMTSQTTVPLCSKLECQHKDSDCDAYISENNCLGHMIWYYNGRLFMIERTDENDCLVSYDKEGRNKENVCTLSDGEAVIGFKNSLEGIACVNNGYLYYVVYNSENDYVNMKRVELKSNPTPQEIKTISINPNTSSYNAFRLYPFENKVYIFENQYITASDITYSIYKYDVNENNISSIVEFKYGDMSNSYRGTIYNWNSNMVVDSDGNIYYVTLLDGEKLPTTIGTGYNKTCILNKYNVSTRTNTELYVLEGTSDKICYPESMIINGYDGNYIYFYEFQNPSTIKKNSNLLIEDSNNLVVVNTGGSIVDKIHFTANTEFLDKYHNNWMVGNIRLSEIIPGNERYIMIATTFEAIQGIEHSDNYMKKNSKNLTETEILAVLDKKQIGTGTYTWIKVKE